MQQKSKVLIVDDNPANLNVATDYLEECDFLVMSARNGEKGLEYARSGQPDLILLDVKMPGLDGFEVCRRLKHDDGTRHIPVIFMTALDGVEDQLEGFRAGGVDYLTKPVQRELMLARVTAHLTIARLQQDLREENNRYRGLVDACFEAVLIHDGGRIVDVNRAMEELLGRPRSTLIGQNAFDLLPEESADLARSKTQQNVDTPYEIAGQNAAGQIVPLEVQGKTIRYHGRDLCVLAMRDVSWRSALEQLQQHTEELASENLSLKATLSDRDHLGALVGASPIMQKVYERIIRAAASYAPVVIRTLQRKLTKFHPGEDEIYA